MKGYALLYDFCKEQWRSHPNARENDLHLILKIIYIYNFFFELSSIYFYKVDTGGVGEQLWKVEKRVQVK